MGNVRPIPPLALDRLLAWNRTYEPVRPKKPWVTRPQTSCITIGSRLMQREGRSCPISPDPVQMVAAHERGPYNMKNHLQGQQCFLNINRPALNICRSQR